MLICMKCGAKGGMGIAAHIFVHIVDLAVAATVAAAVAGGTVGKLGWPGVVMGAVMGMGLGSFRERLRRGKGEGGENPGGQSDTSTPSQPVG